MFRRIAFALALGMLGTLSAAASVSAATIKVMTYNTHHGGTKTNTTDGQLDTIAAQNPDVVVLQEGYASQLSYYVNGLNSRLGTTAWHGKYTMHCKYGTAPTCTSFPGESVMILTRLTTVSSAATLIWAADSYWVARGTLEMEIAAADGTTFHVFACHLPALSTATTARTTYVAAFTSWASNYSGTRLVGGDFNESPTNSGVVAMTKQYTDGWAAKGSGYGYTHDASSPTSRIDYWFSNNTTPSAIAVVPDAVDSDHRPVVATYTVGGTTTTPPPTSTTEQTLMSDAFGTIDRTLWPNGIFTGSTDSTIAMGATSSGAQIGALKSGVTGSHYNGFSSKAYDLTKDGAAAVQLVQPPNTATMAYAMFAAGSDSNNYYRWYEAGNALVAEKRIGGTKTTLVNLPYSAASHQFLRIRHAYNSSTGVYEVVFETAPDNSGVPGTWTVRYREAWNGSVNAAALRFELKAGTSDAVSAPGSAFWDNFKATINTQ
jgi:endonuclease/exonuclease/phosphatase family metal-dependent hydrolase